QRDGLDASPSDVDGESPKRLGPASDRCFDRLLRGRFHQSVLQRRPSLSMSRLASTGPQLPTGYSGSHLVPQVFQPSRMPVIQAQDASTASRRLTSDASPALPSRRTPA